MNTLDKNIIQEFLDDAYKNYLEKTLFDSNPKWLESIPVMNTRTGEKSIGARQYTKEKFIEKIKTDSEFANKWGVRVEKRELSLEERSKIWNETHNPAGNIYTHNQYNENNLPTKLITITYNESKIEVYE